MPALALSGTKTKQNIEAHIDVNASARFSSHSTFSHSSVPPPNLRRDSVRIVWTGSWMVESYSRFDYAVSKVGNWMLAAETAKRYG